MKNQMENDMDTNMHEALQGLYGASRIMGSKTGTALL